jgi:uncharacterized membrane protein YjdF
MSSKLVAEVGFSEQAKAAQMADKPESPKISKREVFLAGVLALIGYTALLLKLPYRTPVLNCLYSGLALGSLYYYLRLRLRMRVPSRVLLCLVLSIVLDMVGNHFGLFSRRIALIPYDIITHFTASGLSFVAVMWILIGVIKQFGYRLPLGFIAFFSVTIAFSLAGYYEITELIDERVFGGHRIWDPRDTSQDLAADLTGIIIAAIAYTLAIRRGRHLADYDSEKATAKVCEIQEQHD